MKKFLRMVLGIILVLSLVACGGSKTTTGKGAVGKKELVAWAWNINIPALEEAAQKWVAENPKYKDVTLKVIEYGQNDVYEKLATSLAAGGQGLPDIILVEDDRVQGYINAFPDGFVNLSAKGFDTHKSKFPSFKWETSSLKGKLYAFPFDTGPAGVFYRKDVFETAGIDASKIETWDDYIEAGKTIKEKTGKTIVAIDATKDDALFRMMMQQLGVYYYDLEGNIDLNNPKVIKAMNQIKKIFDAGINTVADWGGIIAKLQTGELAAVHMGAWYVGTLEAEVKDSSGNWQVMLLPAFEKGGNRASNLGGSNWVIPASSKNQDEAYAFLEYFTTNKDIQLMAMNKYGLFPSLNEVYSEAGFKETKSYFADQSVWVTLASQANDIKTVSFTSDYGKGKEACIAAQGRVFNNEASVEKALKEAADNLAGQTGRKVNSY